MSEIQTKICCKCNMKLEMSYFRYRADKKWFNTVCKPCENIANKILRENRKIKSLQTINDTKLCILCNIYKLADQFTSLDKFRKKQCTACIDCRRIDQLYYKNNKSSVNARTKEYYKNNYSTIKAQRKLTYQKIKINI